MSNDSDEELASCESNRSLLIDKIELILLYQIKYFLDFIC